MKSIPCLVLILVATCLSTAHGLVINEFMAANNGGVPDPQGEYDDWVEIYNETSKTVKLDDLFLTDDLNEPTRWHFPSGISLKKRTYLVIWLDRDEGDTGLHANFSLRAEGETLALFTRGGDTLVDSIAYTPQVTDVSMGRYSDGTDHWVYMSTPTPGAKNRSGSSGRVSPINVSPERGFYEDSQRVTLQTETPNADIWYTLDGTWPGPGRGTRYKSPISISKSSVLHAMAVRSSWQDAAVVSHTYLFPEQIIRQPSKPAGFPSSWGKNKVDYAMDSRVVNSSAYASTIVADLQTIPSLCLSLPNEDLFDSQTGIYANARQRGEDWERMTAMEWIDPVSSEHFDALAGLRTHGGAGRTSSAAKHALRLIFKNDYGPGQLHKALFRDTEVDTFNSLVLRAGWNYTWTGHSGMGGPKHAQYLRDCFARDTVRDMGALTPHGRHVHLYLNGLYWGLYVLCERPDDNFAAVHLGGDAEDYDAVKAGHGTSQASMEVLAGDREAWDHLFDLAKKDLSKDDHYRAIEAYVDISALIDYMLMIFYVGSRDAPTLLGNDKLPRNFYALRRRSPAGPYIFLPWDVEWSLESVSENRVKRLGGEQNPTLLFKALGKHSAFKRQVADRIQELFFHDGALTPALAIERYAARAGQIDRAIVGESARWGDVRRSSSPYTRNKEWVDEYDRLIDTYFTERTETVMNQLRSDKWYPGVVSPVYRINNQLQQGGYADDKDRLTLSGAGKIYYTLDGSDPWRPYEVQTASAQMTSVVAGIVLPTFPPVITPPSGPSSPSDLSGTALPYKNSLTLTRSTRIKARCYQSGWSALHETVFAVGPVAASLRISEIMYHPTDPNAEFLELVNTGKTTLYLDWIQLTKGVQWVAEPFELKSGQYAVVVQDREAFVEAYGSTPRIAGQFSGRLGNGGERLRLEDAAGTSIVDFRFSDQWETRTDGEGYSLVLRDLKTDPASYADPASWRVSKRAKGSPGKAD